MIDTPATPDRAAFLRTLQQHGHLGQLAAIIRAVQHAPDPVARSPEVQLLLARSLADQGRFRQAAGVYDHVLAIGVDDEVVAWELRLWRAFLSIYQASDVAPMMDAGQAARAWAEAHPAHARIGALAHDLTARALAIAVEWGIAPPEQQREALTMLDHALAAYRQAGDHDRALGARLKQGQIALMGTQADTQRVQPIFEEVYAQAAHAGNPVRQAEAALRLAELGFDAAIKQRATAPATPVDPTAYQQALILYEASGHALGPADVRCSLGCRLINAGFDGRDALQQALRIYRETDHLVGIQEVLSALGIWYLRQGNLDAARDCHQQLATLTHEMGFLLGQATAAMAMGDYFFRRGDYARALAAYEQAQALAVPVALQALIALNRANTATLMNMPERAEAACREALARLQPTGRADQRSLAYYILGNARTRQGDWAGAIAVWREGLAIDEASQNWLGQAEKLQAIAQATVMHHYQPGGPPIPDPVYAEAMRLYEAAIARLHNQRDQSAAAVIANTYQLQGQTAITCGRPLDALRYLEQARDAYAHLDMAMQTANTDAMLGLLCYDLGGRGHPDLYGESERFYMQALDYYLTAGMRDTAWKVRFYLALTTFRRGVLSHTPDDQQEYWHQTVDRLNEASQDIDHIRGHFIDRDAVATESGRLALVADKDKVYTFAVQFHYQYLHDAQGAFTWLERLKGRAFLDHLATTPIRTPDLAHPALIAQERALLDALRRSATQTEGIRLSDQLHALWTQMAHDGAATEYVALRRGRPLLWYEMRALLQAR